MIAPVQSWTFSSFKMLWRTWMAIRWTSRHVVLTLLNSWRHIALKVCLLLWGPSQHTADSLASICCTVQQHSFLSTRMQAARSSGPVKTRKMCINDCHSCLVHALDHDGKHLVWWSILLHCKLLLRLSRSCTTVCTVSFPAYNALSSQKEASKDTRRLIKQKALFLWHVREPQCTSYILNATFWWRSCHIARDIYAQGKIC